MLMVHKLVHRFNCGSDVGHGNVVDADKSNERTVLLGDRKTYAFA